MRNIVRENATQSMNDCLSCFNISVRPYHRTSITHLYRPFFSWDTLIITRRPSALTAKVDKLRGHAVETHPLAAAAMTRR